MVLDAFLAATPIVDWSEPSVLALARWLAEGRTTDAEVARGCFEWVRDHVRHTVDHRLDRVTCSASEVLEARTGFCYAKSHLLAAVLRANTIPAGFVYQRLALDEAAGTFCLHGLNAVWLSGVGWYRLDARGDREDLRARFEPPREVLPFSCRLRGERLFPVVYSEPLAIVCDALRRHATRSELERHLPDAP
jgi:transglutaminase-like putative cysteine protease